MDRFNLMRRARGFTLASPLGAIMLLAAVVLLSMFAPERAQAQATCTINWGTVPYGSTNNQYVMSETVNPAVLAACDPLYPSLDSGVAPPITGGSTGGGTWSGIENVDNNTIVYSPHPRWVGPDAFTMYFCNDAGCTQAGRLVATVNVTVAAPTLTMTPTVGNGTVGVPYNQRESRAAIRSASGRPVRSTGAVRTPRASATTASPRKG